MPEFVREREFSGLSARAGEPARRMRHTKRTHFARWRRPIPGKYPRYDHAAGHSKERKRIEIYPRIDALFVLYATLLSVILAALFLREGFTGNPKRLVNILVFWLVFTYVALPRLHQALTRVYVPDYFIGRTRTADGLLGDPVNMAFEGEERDIHVAMRRAGWVMAEENTLHSARKMITAFLLFRSYPEAPVSSLFLFGRRHEFAYQQEVGGTTVKRHHIRFWRVPKGWVMPGGHRLTWLAAATYDRSVGFSRYTWQITHKIDENTDVERDYVVDTLLWADPEIPVGVIKDYSTSYHHVNGGGDPLRTDGHLPVVNLRDARERSEGSTAILQPRDRPNGVSYLKGRSIRPTELVDSLQRNWHGAFDDFVRALKNAGDHHLPPPSITLTGAIIAVQAGIMALVGFRSIPLVGWLTNFLALSEIGVTQETLPALAGIEAALVILFAMILRRNRWARLALMALLAVDSTVRLFELWWREVGTVAASQLISVGLMGLALMALTSDAARLWVHSDRFRARYARRGNPETASGFAQD